MAALIVASAVVIARGFDVGADRAWGVPAIRLNLLILALLFAAAFLIPMTSGQAIDIMRAWADEGARRPAFALAAALLLGEMMRESGLRLGGEAGHGPTTLRIFRGVTVMPTLVLFVGAVSAATDSVLLVRPWADRWVLGSCLTAVGVGAVMALLVRTVIGRPPGGAAVAWPFSDSRATFWAAAAAGALAGMLLGLRPELPADRADRRPAALPGVAAAGRDDRPADPRRAADPLRDRRQRRLRRARLLGPDPDAAPRRRRGRDDAVPGRACWARCTT